MVTWDDIVAIDRRVAAIASSATNLVASGDENREFPDAVYTEAKRYLNALVGFGRGGSPVPSSPGNREDYGSVFAPVLRHRVPTTTPDQERILRTMDAYQVVCTHLYDQLCEAYDWRHRWAA